MFRCSFEGKGLWPCSTEPWPMCKNWQWIYSGYKENLCQDWEKVVSSNLLLVTNIAGVLHAELLVGTLLYQCTEHCGIYGVFRLTQSCNLWLSSVLSVFLAVNDICSKWISRTIRDTITEQSMWQLYVHKRRIHFSLMRAVRQVSKTSPKPPLESNEVLCILRPSVLLGSDKIDHV
jgi:hypothetical protein